MLELKSIVKDYVTGDTTVKALKGVDIEFRKNEFVAILGPSGCGKTTLLNIVGGLDQYTSGDLIIEGTSTKKYASSDWDTYRNHSVGFVFQSYNLIPHQTVLNNVELALTMAGITKAERKKRAIEALNRVGLEDQINKRPNQLSGGQMQRVAIARAIVNNPQIVLADEPTGALDTTTSLQVMEILKEIASDRLVIMVTHNPQLAKTYANRTVELLDGKLISDSNPYNSAVEGKQASEKQKEKDANVGKKIRQKKKSSMSYLTALSLSLNNLFTKKARTIMTAFAGSIGIIGIALILSLSSGFQQYIKKIEEDTLSTYPITIDAQTYDITTMLGAMIPNGDSSAEEHDLDAIYGRNIMAKMLTAIIQGEKHNDLASFKTYLDGNEELKDRVSAISYGYNAKLNIYKDSHSETDNTLLIPFDMALPGLGLGMGESSLSNLTVWQEMLDNQELLESQYELLGTGSKWPTNYNEVIVVVNKNNEINDYMLYALGLKSKTELMELMGALATNPNYVQEVPKYSYEDILGLKYKLVLDSDYYQLQTNGTYKNMSDDKAYMNAVLTTATELKVVGIVRTKDNAQATSINGAIGYSKTLTEEIVKRNQISDVVIAQKAEMEKTEPRNLLTGELFSTTQSIRTTEYNDVINKIGGADLTVPSSISIYPNSFESKEYIVKMIEDYNLGKATEDQIQYTDYIGLMMSSISTIINAITYVLIAFVAISLVVSSIMIGIITYISVLERTKEIGILRSIGARKKDISRVFNAETLLIGFVAGMLGIIVTIILDIPINIIINHLAGIGNVAKLPFWGGFFLVVISMVLTVIAGLIPSKVAANKDPVIALRSE